MTVLFIFTIFNKNNGVTMDFIKFNKSLFDLNFKPKNEILQLRNKNIHIAFNMNGCFGNVREMFFGIGNLKFTEFIYTNHFEVYCFETDKECKLYFETFQNEGVDINIHIGPEEVLFEKRNIRFTKTGKPKKDKIEEVLNPKLEEFFNMPKIDLTIMNPPWDTKTDLHVEIVKTILEKTEAAISVMPNDFLKTDEYNKKHSRYRNTKIDTMLDCNDEFSIEDTNNLFGLSYSTNCSILYWKTNGSYDYDTVFNDTSKIKEQKKKIENTIQKLIRNDSVFKSHKKFVKLTEYNGTGYFIPIGTHGANIATEFGLIENNEKAYNYNGKEIFFDKEKFYSLTTNNSGKGIYVSSKNEGIRLLKLFRSENYMEFQKWTKFSCNGNFRHLLEFCPILKDNETIISEQTEKEILKLIKDIK